jgi:hypothetical protein
MPYRNHLVWPALILVILSRPAASFAEVDDEPSVIGVRSRLFQTNSGELASQDISDPKFPGFINNPMSPETSNAILVVVELSGPPGRVYNGVLGPGTKRSVKLVAQETRSGKQLLNVAQVVPNMSDRGKTYVAFLVYHGDCSPIRLCASIVGQKKSAPMFKRDVFFGCGE